MSILKLLLELSEVDVKTLDVDAIKPEKKDHDRAEGLKFRGRTFHGDNSPFASEATKMAKLIKDPQKLVRRAKAVAQLYGSTKRDPYGGNAGYYTPGKDGRGGVDTEVFAPFSDALKKMGFTREQIKKIENSKD